MNDQRSLLSKSFSILHSCLSIVLITYLLDVIFARLVYLGMWALAMLLVLPAKVWVFSGIYGALVELVSGEEIVFKLSHVKRNAKEFWKIYLLFAVMPFLFYAVMILSGINLLHISIYVIYAHLNIFIMYGMAHFIFHKKYCRPGARQKVKPVMTGKMFVTLFVLYALYVLIFDLPYFYDPDAFDLTRITLIGFNYLNFMIFLYLAIVLQEQHPEVEKSFIHEKEIYLVNPLGGGLFFHLGSMALRHYPPVFVVIKALSPKGYQFREFNQHSWHERYYAGNKLVAITCFTSNSPDCYRIAHEFRKRGSKVVLGGPHVTFLPDEALEYCDSVVVGEVESVWEEVIKDYENNSLKRKYTGVPVSECHTLVHQELLNSPPEIIKDFLETTRGCKFKCHFCTVPAISGGKVRTQPIFDVVELIKKVKSKYRSVSFIDNNIYNDPAYAKELFKALKLLNIKWATQCTIDIAKNDEVLRLAKDSGCYSFLIGFEISDSSLEKQEGGKLAMATKYRQYAKKIQDLGIRIKAHFIFGFESDNFKGLWNFWKFCFSIRPFITIMSILTPFPGSKVYDDMIKEDCISNLNWRHYGAQSLVFKHKKMNNFLLARLWPAIYLLFFFTTSKVGYILLAFIFLNVVGMSYIWVITH